MPVLASDLDANPKKSRTRSPAYPYLDLRSALDKAATLWRAEGRHAAAVNVVMHHWGYKEESSTGHSCMAALKKFGLIEHDGMGENKQIRLSDLAQAILRDDNPDSPARVEALRAAALGPRIHAELWERYGSDLPSDQSLKRYLVLEKSFNEAVVEELVAEYKATIAFAGLDLLPAPAASVAASPGTAPDAPNRYSPPPAPLVEDLPYDRRETAPAPSQPPPRAIGPRRDLPDAYHPAQREAGAAAERPYPPAPRAAAPAANDPRRRETAPAYAPNARQATEREFSRYDQEAFGYEEEFVPPAPSFQPSVPVSARPSAQPPAQSAPAPGIEVDGFNGAPHKELPVPLDGDRVALVPYPMTEEDFTLLIATLQLWKKRLVR